MIIRRGGSLDGFEELPIAECLAWNELSYEHSSRRLVYIPRNSWGVLISHTSFSVKQLVNVIQLVSDREHFPPEVCGSKASSFRLPLMPEGTGIYRCTLRAHGFKKEPSGQRSSTPPEGRTAP